MMSISLSAASNKGMLKLFFAERPIDTTLPPLLVPRMAKAIADSAPEHSMATFKGLCLRTFCTTSGAAALYTAEAPSDIANWSRSSFTSVTTMVVAPHARATNKHTKPIGPAPVIRTPEPGPTPAREQA
eukprot:TRINITY_DN4933_c0_g1_i1.p2 TRINITY_DN4933_c0_g1~~TRINITY_DN4933_c0_g1_i1.p2  ORF type:complete len:129 (+),score=21.51 TRINITY_DN4933_c0_g1_i1:209-595(+)